MPPAFKEILSFPLFGLVLAVLCGVLAALSGFGTRWNWWHFSTGFTILKAAAMGALASIVIAAGGALIPAPAGGIRLAAAAGAVVLGLVVAGIPWYWLREVKRLPYIHDISTDTADPPQFKAVLAERKGAANPAEYGGPEVALLQHRAYPQVAPSAVPAPPDRTFDRALRVAREMGWMIVDADRQEGRIEATDRTFWFGFKDDVVIRVRQEGPGSRVDVRSLSRVGKSDVGTNARRNFLGSGPYSLPFIVSAQNSAHIGCANFLGSGPYSLPFIVSAQNSAHIGCEHAEVISN
jgi:hypothetical protein